MNFKHRQTLQFFGKRFKVESFAAILAEEVKVSPRTIPSFSFLFVVSALLAFWTPLHAQDQAPFNETIIKEDLRADLFFLASDGMQGRLTGTPESSLAAEYIKSRFERMGLKAVGPGDSYYQPYNLMSATLGEENLLEIVLGDDASLRLRPRQDYYPHRFSASGRVRGSVVFAGFGIAAPKLGYDDYRGQAVQGNIVLVLDNEPGRNDPKSPFEGVVSSHYSRPMQKALTAQAKGAIGILFVQDVHNETGPGNFEASAKRYWPETPGGRQRYQLADWVEKIRIPAAQISPSMADILLRGTGKSLEQLARAADNARGTSPIRVPDIYLELTTSVNRHVLPDRNVVGLIEGSDPSVKDEWIILCAHYDHVGVDEGGRVFNGADDDGSGVVALFEIAEAYAMAARDGIRPRRGHFVRGMELGGIRAPRRLGLHGKTTNTSEQDRGGLEHGHDRSQPGGSRRRWTSIPRVRSSNGGIQRITRSISSDSPTVPICFRR